MPGTSARHDHWRRTARHVLRSPKGYMLILFGGIAVLGTASEGLSIAAPGLVASVAAAALTDAIMRRLTGRRLEFPSGAIVTGLVVAFVFSPYESELLPAAASASGLVLKYLVRSGPVNVLNPAAAGLVLVALVFGGGESWWGGLPDYGLLGLLLVLLPGLFIGDHVNKLPLLIAFFATYFSLFTASAFGPNSVEVAEIFRAPDLHMAVFFACYMLDDPPTSPVRYPDQIWYGALVGGIAYALFTATGVVYFLPAALLAGNVVEAGRRRTQSHRHRRHLHTGNAV